MREFPVVIFLAVTLLALTIESTSLYDDESYDCEIPECSFGDAFLYPHRNLSLYYACAPSSSTEWEAMERPCSPTLKFDVEAQAFTYKGLDVCPEITELPPTVEPEE